MMFNRTLRLKLLIISFLTNHVLGEKVPALVLKHLFGFTRDTEENIGRLSAIYFPRRKLPDGDIFKDKEDADELDCDKTFAIGTKGHEYFTINSKKPICSNSFLGSKVENCTVGILCEGHVRFEDDRCDKQFFILYDGLGGLQKACKAFTFNNVPRHARNHGTDLYIYYSGASNGVCIAFCLEDLNDSHKIRPAKQLVKSSSAGPQFSSSCKCGVRRDFGRVVGGEDAMRNEFPWMAGIVWKFQYGFRRRPYCGGALISDRYVISAAHCFQEGLQEIKGRQIQVLLHSHVMDPFVDVGESHDDPEYQNVPGWNSPVETDESDGTIRMDVEEIINHPLFTFYGYDWDVALIKLKKPVDISSGTVVPICLPEVGEHLEYPSESVHVVAGWGLPWEGSKKMSRILQKVDVLYEDPDTCSKYKQFSRRHLCAGYIGGGKDACQGDSGFPGAASLCGLGGPLMYKFNPEANQYLLSGVVSTGVGCAREMKLGLYTNTKEIIQWIYHHTRSNTVWCQR